MIIFIYIFIIYGIYTFCTNQLSIPLNTFAHSVCTLYFFIFFTNVYSFWYVLYGIAIWSSYFISQYFCTSLTFTNLFISVFLVVICLFLASTSQLILIFLLLEIFTLCTLFLIFQCKLLYKILLLWYLYMLNNILFFCIICLLYQLYAFFLIDFFLFITLNTYMLGIIHFYIFTFLLFFYMSKFYMFLFLLMFEQIYSKLHITTFLLFLTIYIFSLLHIFTHLLFSNFYIFLSIMIYINFIFLTVLLTSTIQQWSLLLVNSNFNLLFFLQILGQHFDYFIIFTLILYFSLYTCNLYLYVTCLLYFNVFHLFNVNRNILYFGFFQFCNVFSNYFFFFALIICIVNFGGLPIGVQFVVKLFIITSYSSLLFKDLLLFQFIFFFFSYYGYAKMILFLFFENIKILFLHFNFASNGMLFKAFYAFFIVYVNFDLIYILTFLV